MKKRMIFAALILIVAGTGVYLNLAYSHIFSKIGSGGLIFPDARYEYELGSGGQPITYVAMGDSLTAGAGVSDYSESYPYLVAEKLASASQVLLEDVSVPGGGVADLSGFRLESAIAANPDIITILIGVNDIHNLVRKKDFKDNYSYIVGQMKERTHAKIYLVSIPFIGSNTLHYFPYNIYFAWQTEKYNEIIKSLADSYGVGYIDIATPTRDAFRKDGIYYCVDSFHPSAEGYKLWVNIIYDGINQ